MNFSSSSLNQEITQNNTKNKIKIMQNYSHNSKIQQEKHEQNFWDRINEEMQIIDAEKEEFKTQELPLSRIKRLMKLESEILDESAKYMVSSEAPILFAKACEIFILELTLRAWKYADDEKRRTLLSSDITKAVSRSEMYDFLIDIIPREDIQIQEYLQHIKTGSSSTSLPIPLASDPTSQGTSNPQIPLRPLTTSQINPPITYPSQSQQTIAPTPTYVPYTYNSQQTQNQSVYSHLQPQLQPQQQLQLQPQSTTSSIPPIQPYTYPNYPNTSNTTIDHSLHSHNHNNNNNNNKTTTTGNNPTTFYPHNHHISQQQQPQPQHLSHQHHIPDSSTTSTSTPITSTSSISSSLSSYSLQTRPNVYPIYPSQHQTPHG